jgi:hypothetical protein
MISTDGTKWVGEFRENKRWNIREYDNNGNNTGKFRTENIQNNNSH